MLKSVNGPLFKSDSLATLTSRAQFRSLVGENRRQPSRSKSPAIRPHIQQLRDRTWSRKSHQDEKKWVPTSKTSISSSSTKQTKQSYSLITSRTLLR